MSPNPFHDRFIKQAETYSAFCWGIDPSSALLHQWGLETNIDGLGKFCDRALQAACGHVGIIKPQIAFFEQFGAQGMLVLQEFVAQAQAENILVIADVKRGDIGSSMQAYAQAWLGETGFGADALTLSAYLGFDALKPAFDMALARGKYCFVVVRSSNPEGNELQNAKLSDDISVAESLALQIQHYNKTAAYAHKDSQFGVIGAVLGATIKSGLDNIITSMPSALFLLPGLGAQGADFSDIQSCFSAAVGRLIPTSSRAVLQRGPDISALQDSLDDHCAQMRGL